MTIMQNEEVSATQQKKKSNGLAFLIVQKKAVSKASSAVEGKNFKI